MALASKHDILNCQDFKTTTIDVDCWGQVCIRELSANERVELVSIAQGKDGEVANEDATLFYTKLVAMSLVDDKGSRLFDPNNPDDLEALKTRAWQRLEHMAEKVMAFNGMSDDEQEDTAKN